MKKPAWMEKWAKACMDDPLIAIISLPFIVIISLVFAIILFLRGDKRYREML